MRRTVQDVMTREVVAVPGATPFKELVRLLNANRVTAVPVPDDGRVVVGVEKMTGTIDGVVAVESRLVWPVDVDVLPVPPEPAPLL